MTRREPLGDIDRFVQAHWHLWTLQIFDRGMAPANLDWREINL
jgi:hypothetical protein